MSNGAFNITDKVIKLWRLDRIDALLIINHPLGEEKISSGSQDT